MHKPVRLQQPCLVPHNSHRRITCNPRTPGIPQPVRSLQRFVDFPTRRLVKLKHTGSPHRSFDAALPSTDRKRPHHA
ncbi:hypothetical protein T261_2841 [Streptomyces lydicus]|nr:hypothetical protein T261_2841 [Streptomyces lydicus]